MPRTQMVGDRFQQFPCGTDSSATGWAHCASPHLKSQEREKGASTKGAGVLLLGRAGCKCWAGSCSLQGSARAVHGPGCLQTLTWPVLGLLHCSSSAHNREELFALCSHVRARQVLRNDTWKIFFPSVFCLVQHLDQNIHSQWGLFSVISVHLC